MKQFSHIFAKIALDEHSVPLVIEDLALLVQDVVIFQQMLAAVEVCSFHTRLGLFDCSIDDSVRDGCGIVDVQALHQTRHLRAAE